MRCALLMLAACGTAPHPAVVPSEQLPEDPRVARFEIVLEDAIEDAVRAKQRRIANALDTAKIAATVARRGDALTIAVEDPAQRDDARAVVARVSGDTYALVECPQVCAKPTARFAEQVREDTTVEMVRAMEKRLAARHVAGTVRAEGGRVVVELPTTPREELAAVKAFLARAARLSFEVVDEDSELARRLYGTVAVGEPDPAARKAGISAGVDEWRADNGTRHTDYYLRAYDDRAVRGDAILAHYIAGLARDPKLAIPPDHRIRYERVYPETRDTHERPYTRTYYVERDAQITGRDVQSVSEAMDPNSYRPIVLVDFTPYATRAFGELTTRIAGRKLAIVVDDEVVSAPIINGPITGGRASIAIASHGEANQQREAKDLMDAFRAGPLPARVREVPAR